MTAINMTVRTLVTATDPGWHPSIIPDFNAMPFLKSPRAVLLRGDDLKNNTTLADTLLVIADVALTPEVVRGE